jgi:hypothetical protein
MTETYLAGRIRAVAAGELPLSELRKIATQVESLERAMDREFQTARWQDAAIDNSETVYRWKATR